MNPPFFLFQKIWHELQFVLSQATVHGCLLANLLVLTPQFLSAKGKKKNQIICGKKHFIFIVEALDLGLVIAAVIRVNRKKSKVIVKSQKKLTLVPLWNRKKYHISTISCHPEQIASCNVIQI